MKYMNKRNGKVVELVNMDEKYKTVELREAGQEKTFTCTTSTFKRWYKKLEEQEVVEPMTDEQVEAQLLEQAQAVVDAEPLTSVPVCVVEDTPEVKPEKKARAKTDMKLCDVPCRLTAPNHTVAQINRSQTNAEFI